MAQSFAGLRFCGCPINRAAALSIRKDPAAVKQIRESPDARFLLVSERKVLVTSSKLVRLSWLSFDKLCKLDPSAVEASIYLGPLPLKQGVIAAECFAAHLTSRQAISLETVWLTGRELMTSDASDAEVAIAGLALAMFGWHETALYDGRSGKRTIPVEGGMKRKVEEGSSKVYPRTDPVVIGLIESPDGSKCLLGRSRNYHTGMYTCLSGFIEQCESVEEAFAREVMEEVGVQLKDITLVASQPWPIGRAGSCELMLGCHAVACSDEIKINRAELEDARWFTKAEVSHMLARGTSASPYSAIDGALFVPPPFAIAHHLIKQFASKRSDSRYLMIPARNAIGFLIASIAAGFMLAQTRRSLSRI